MVNPPGPLSPDDDQQTKDAVVAINRLETLVAESDEYDELSDLFEEVNSVSEALDVHSDRLAEVEERLDSHNEMFKTLFGIDARREATDDVYEDFFPTPTDGRSRLRMERRRSLLRALLHQASENGEDKAVLYKKKVQGKPLHRSARFALREDGVEPPESWQIGRDLREIARVVPGAVWKQDGQRGQNRKALFFSAEKFLDGWDGYEE